MLRAPMSRMDILSSKELKDLIDLSKISVKYNADIDSESAYEILNSKIESIHKQVEVVKEKKKNSSRTKKSGMDPIVKVLTSATFIRGVFKVLNKVLK